MKTIIVPVDFSPASLNAANYAADLASTANATVALFHVYTFPMPVSEIPVAPMSIEELIDSATQNINDLKAGLQHRCGNQLNITTTVREGGFALQLESFCKEINPYAVVMGAFGKSALERVLFGSNTLAAMKHLSWPVIVVPPGTRYTSIMKLGLACDLQNVQESVHADKITALVKEFNASLHVLHITPEKHGLAAEEALEGAEALKKLLKELNPVFHFMQHNNVDEAIRDFAEENNLDMLIMVPRNHGIIEGLLHKSHTKALVLHSHIPVMSIHE
jgi:nucleotide-binding universal stress UspA family protein